MEALAGKKLFLFDLDGTICMGDQLYPFSRDLLRTIRSTGRDYLFMTNNSSRSARDYGEKLTGLGIPSEEREFITSGQAAVHYLKEKFGNRRIYVCGTGSLLTYLRREGLSLTEDPGLAQCVLIGLDTELTFEKLRNVCRILWENPGIPYFATHPDLICPTEFGFMPDCGSICQMISHACGREPEYLGKPSPLMVRLAMAQAGCSPEETVVVGDRLSTDIEAGASAGVDTVLVMTGEAGAAGSQCSQVRPTWVLPDAGEILRYIL